MEPQLLCGLTVKAKEFWKYLCGTLDYRLFAGVPCLGLLSLYSTMDKDDMHYIPTVNERIALGIVNGSWLAGVKGGVLMSSKAFIGMGNEVNMIKNFNIPMLVIVDSDNGKTTYPFWHVELSDKFEKDLDKIARRSKV